MIPQVLAFFGGVSLILVVVAIKALIAPHGIFCHLIWPFEKRLILNLFQHLTHWLSEHSINCLRVSSFGLPNKVSLWSVIIVSVRPEIPHLLRDNLSLTFPLLLVFLNPFVFLNPIHEFTHTSDRFTNQRFPQTVLSWEADLKSTDSHVIEFTIYVVVHLPVPV